MKPMMDTDTRKACILGVRYAFFIAPWLALLLLLIAGPCHAVMQRGTACPCAQVPFFASFTQGHRQLLACTDQTPVGFAFVRLVATDFDLIVAVAWDGSLWCGWQPQGWYTTLLPVTPIQYQTCRMQLHRAAARQGIVCGVEQ